MPLSIKTNHQPRDLVCWHNLPPKFQKEMDYIDESERHDCRFFIYRDWVYDVCEFERIAPTMLLHHPQMAGWHGYQSDSFFSGVLVKYDDRLESVIPATFYS